ncbi:polar amino acid transport system permease protein [Comamonas odontotermitis]|uniref:Polar amino acid transport system permease protein n=1 Tax=Comamonas odontotermitis TaxID=379895 RepID=A0ABR6RBK1_9BURK|nr:amino acid ABC transporter permease [Comamonas odontotermitis]MBB6576529.1 polar amino acid transport system permease protein [Comamonas odontotermitis]
MHPFLSWLDPLWQHLLAGKYWHWLLGGWWVTVLTSLLVIAAATVLGIGFALARNSRLAPVRGLALVYLSAFRNTPLLVQLFFWYFGVPSLLPAEWVAWLNRPHPLGGGWLSLDWPSFEFISAAVGLVFYSTAYVGEEVRAGIRSVAPSQIQAARSLGMTGWQLQRYIVLPQALATITSPLLGQYMNIIKNTSLGMTIGLVELSYRARQAEAETFQSFQVYGITTLLYIVLILVVELLSQHLARRRRWGRVQPGRA